jgi:hypothetical protein
MEQVITQVIAAISPSALPIVVCVLGLGYIYWKISSQRKETKVKRDADYESLDKRVTLLEHDCDFMKQQHALFGQKLDKILEELTNIKVELAKKEDK